jgi:diguanylate cyclase (GGDEF)-like protein
VTAAVPTDARDRAKAPELLDRLTSYLTESVAVVNAEGRITTFLGRAGHLIDKQHGSATTSAVLNHHVFEYCEPEDLPHALELAVEALDSAAGWSATRTLHLRDSKGRGGRFEVRVENREDDPVIKGFIIYLRLLREPEVHPDVALASELGQGLESLASAVPLPIAFISSDARLIYLNEAAREFCGGRTPALQREGLGALSSGPGRAEIERAVAELIERPGEQTIVVESEIRPGERRIVDVTISALGRNERVVALFATLLDVTARRIEESELRRRASSDPLTGLHNRMELEDALSQRLRAGPGRVGVLYVDLDGFKAVNDTFGHDAGDDFLVEVAAILRTEVRASDLVGRLGGDEFLLIVDLDEEDGAAGVMALETLGNRVARAVALFAQTEGLGVTASVGVEVGQLGDTPRELLRRADSAMYATKRQGRLPQTAS